MSDQPVNYEAVIADLEAKKAAIDNVITALRALTSTSGTTAQAHSGHIAPNEFHGLSITDAVKKYLGVLKQKQSTQDLIKALDAGGPPPVSYPTLYAVLRRRQKTFGDIVNMKGDWGLAEWYPNFKFKSGKPEPTGVPLDEDDVPKNEEENQA
jgi:hypothetical protein